jgi:type I restriction-modification system DNA methylase subunit
MPAFQCNSCKKIFKLKTDLERHNSKKIPCISVNELIIEEVNKIVENKQKNNDDIAKVKRFLDFCHNTLRDKEGIVGMKALSNIAMLLFLRFVNNSVKSGNIDLLNIEKYREEEGSITGPFKIYKKYIKYCKFENIIKDGKYANDFEINELPTIIEFIFRHVLWHHPKTKNVFTDEIPTIKNDITYEQILKQMDKIDWDNMEIDVKGLAYEHFLKDEMGGGDLGQFFTKREVVDYMIDVIKPYIKETSTFIDPFMGTGGFITHMFNEIRSIYIKKNIPFTDEIKNKLVNGIEKNPQTCLLSLNNMLLNMDMFPTNVKCDDSFRNYIDKKFDLCITNPPFGIKGLSYDDESMFPDEKNGIKKNKYLPYKSNDAICLALQMIQHILNKNGIGAIVVPDGKQMNSEKEKSLIAVRKMLIENNNLFQITKLPPGTFLPYTGVETMILFFKKGEHTKDVKFVKLDDKYKSETLICNVNIKKIIEKNYSLNYKLYIDNNKNLYTNIEYKTISDIFECIKGTIQSSKIENNENGKYSFVTGAEDYKFKKVNLLKDENLINGENLFVSHRGNGDSRPVKYYNGQCYFSDLMTLLKPKININIKFAYYYLKFNQLHIEEKYQKGACNKTLDFTLFNSMQIPIPPIPIQNLIVQELNSMYKQKEALQTAINEMNTFRKAKFEMELSKCNKQNVSLGDYSNIKTGKNKPSDGLEDGKKYPYYGTGGITGHTDEYLIDGDYLLTPRNGSVGTVFICNGKSFPSDHMFIIQPNEHILIKYLNYSMMSNNLAFHKTGAIIPNITREILVNLQIILPSLKDQELIIKQMELYDNLVTLQQNQIIELDLTIKERFEYHLKKCEDGGKLLTIPQEETDDIDILEDNLIKTTRKSNIKIVNDEESNKSVKSTKSDNSATLESDDDPIETILVGKVECVQVENKYYKYTNGVKGDIYAITNDKGKTVLYKKPVIKKVEINNDLDELEKELGSTPKMKK